MAATEIKAHAQDIQAMAFSPVGNYLATGSADRTSRVWNGQSGKLVSDLKAHARAQWAACWSPDGKYIATGGYDSPARLWEIQTGQVISSLGSEKRVDPLLAEMWKIPGIASNILKPTAVSSVRAISWSPSGHQLAVLTSNGEGIVELWDVAKAQRTALVKTGQRFVSSLAWSTDGNYLATGGRTNQVGEAATRIWIAATGRQYGQFDFQGEQQKEVDVKSLAWSPDGRYLARGGANVSPGILDTSNGQVVAPLIEASLVAWASRRSFLATVSDIPGPAATVKITFLAMGQRPSSVSILSRTISVIRNREQNCRQPTSKPFFSTASLTGSWRRRSRRLMPDSCSW